MAAQFQPKSRQMTIWLVAQSRVVARWLVPSTHRTSHLENATADASQHFPDEIWFVEQKTLETKDSVEFELSSVFDLMGVQFTLHVRSSKRCPWKYRGRKGISGPYFDKNNNPGHIAQRRLLHQAPRCARPGETSSPTGSSLWLFSGGNTCSVILNPLPAPR